MMSEEILAPVVDEQVAPEVAPEVLEEAPVVEAVEQMDEEEDEALLELAVAHGYNKAIPKDDPKWKPAKDYIKFGLEKSDALSRKVKHQDKVLEQLAAQVAQMRDQAFKKALDELQTRKVEAMHSGDSDAFFKYEQEQQQTFQAAQQAAQQSMQIDPPVVTEFKAANPWLKDLAKGETGTDEERIISAAFLETCKSIAATDSTINRERAPEEVLADVMHLAKKKMVMMFPEQFQNPKRAATPAVAPAPTRTPAESKKPKVTFDKLPPEHQSVARLYEKNGVMTVDEYIKAVYRG